VGQVKKGLSKEPFLVILSAVLAEALSGAKGKNPRNVDSTRVRRPFTQFTLSGKRRCFAALSMTASEGFRVTWARFFDSPKKAEFLG